MLFFPLEYLWNTEKNCLAEKAWTVYLISYCTNHQKKDLSSRIERVTDEPGKMLQDKCFVPVKNQSQGIIPTQMWVYTTSQQRPRNIDLTYSRLRCTHLAKLQINWCEKKLSTLSSFCCRSTIVEQSQFWIGPEKSISHTLTIHTCKKHITIASLWNSWLNTFMHISGNIIRTIVKQTMWHQ